MVLPGPAQGDNKPDLFEGDVTQWPHTGPQEVDCQCQVDENTNTLHFEGL